MSSSSVDQSNARDAKTQSDGEQVVFIVGGSTGEYSDRNEWTSRAFTRREDAEAFVALLTERRQQLAAQGHHLDWDARDAVEQSMRVFDPGYSEDYTGTSWWIAETPLHSGPFGDTSTAEAASPAAGSVQTREEPND